MFDVGTDPGEWRPVPPLANNVFSWVGDVRPFALKRSDQLKTSGPPPLKSKQYTREFNEVKTLGAKSDSTRNSDQEALALASVGGVGLGHDPRVGLGGRRGLAGAGPVPPWV